LKEKIQNIADTQLLLQYWTIGTVSSEIASDSKAQRFQVDALR